MAMSSDDEINLLVKDVVAASKLPPKSRSALIKPTINNLCSLAYDRGLLPDALDELLGLVTAPSLLDQASLGAILRNLYPVTKVSREHALRAVAAVGIGRLKPSLTVQGLLLRWLIMVYHTLEAPAVLSQAYTVLFNLLDTAAIRPQLAHLLALITRRKHVRPFRIQYLLNLSRQTGNDPVLVGLLRVYKDYYPEIIVGEAVRGRASAFKHPDPSWRERLDALQEAHIQLTQERMQGPRDGFRVNKVVGRVQRNKVLPSVHTTHATEDSVTLEEIESVQSFVQNIDKLELPNQLVAVLADPLLQKLLVLRPSTESYQRVANWLNSVLQDVIDGDADEATLWEVLEVVRDFVVQTKNLPSLILNFFARLFQLWRGTGNRSCIFAILSYSPFHNFEDLYKHVYQPLEAAVADNTSTTLTALLTMYTNLLHHWTAILRSSQTIPSHASNTIGLLTQHVNSLSLTLLQASPPSSTVVAESTIFPFYEQNRALVTDARLKQYIRIELPSAPLIYTLFFSTSLATVSRICYILGSCKPDFEAAMSTPGQRQSGMIDSLSYDSRYVATYNGYLVDISNCFWRSQGFGSTDEEGAQGCQLPRTTMAALTRWLPSVDRSYSLPSILSLSYSPLLCLQSINSLREIEDAEMETNEALETRHAGPVNDESLARLRTSGGVSLKFKEYRINVLEALNAKGLTGIEVLLKNLLRKLKPALEARARARGTVSAA